MSKQLIIYGTEICPFCIQARDSYGDRAVFIDVSKHPEKLQEMLILSGGRRQIPVIVEDDRVTVGFMGKTSLRGAVPLSGGT